MLEVLVAICVQLGILHLCLNCVAYCVCFAMCQKYAIQQQAVQAK